MPFLNPRPEFLEPAWATGAKQALKLGQLVFFRRTVKPEALKAALLGTYISHFLSPLGS